MPERIEGRVRELLEAPNFCQIATVSDVRRDPRVTLCVPNHDNPYEYVTIWGRVVDETHEGADENINFLSQKYLGEAEYPFRKPGEQRVLFRIEPEKVLVYGG